MPDIGPTSARHRPDIRKKLGANPVTNTVLNGWQFTGMTRIWSDSPFPVPTNGNPGALSQLVSTRDSRKIQTVS